jgi:hypothetical protein
MIDASGNSEETTGPQTSPGQHFDREEVRASQPRPYAGECAFEIPHSAARYPFCSRSS